MTQALVIESKIFPAEHVLHAGKFVAPFVQAIPPEGGVAVGVGVGVGVAVTPPPEPPPPLVADAAQVDEATSSVHTPFTQVKWAKPTVLALVLVTFCDSLWLFAIKLAEHVEVSFDHCFATTATQAAVPLAPVVSPPLPVDPAPPVAVPVETVAGDEGDEVESNLVNVPVD